MLSTRGTLEIKSDFDRCDRCGRCEAACPSGVFMHAQDSVDVVYPGRCIGCGHCVAACPEGALSHSELRAESFTSMSQASPGDRETLLSLFRERRSCRRFSTEPLSRETIESLIDDARFSPTATNSQNVRFAVFAGRSSIRKLVELTSRHYLKLDRQLRNPITRLVIAAEVGIKTANAYQFRMPAIAEMFKKSLGGDDRLFYGAPAVIVSFASGLPHLAAASCGLAAMQILLSAEASGLGACFNGYALTALVRDKKTRQDVGISRGYTPGAVIAVGKPTDGFYRVPPRRKKRVIWIGD